MSQPVLHSTARRLAVARPLPAMSLMRAVVPAASLAGKRYAAIDSSQATPAKPSEAMTILENQRLYRPVSPHLQIYQPQMTWIPSIMNRVTGSVLSGALYIFGATYALGPLVGFHFTAAGMAAAVGAWPLLVKVPLKFLFGWQFMFHSINGLRHLFWDIGWGLTNQAVIRSGWAVLGLSTVGTIGLLFL